MILLFQLTCLCITLFALQKYITTGTYSRKHRLLPLILGLIGVYNFFQIASLIVPAPETFAVLKDMLLLQMLHLLMFYVLDFLLVSTSELLQSVLVILILVMDIGVCMQYKYGKGYDRAVLGFTILYMVLILSAVTYAYIVQSFSKRENRIATWVYIAFLVPAVALCLQRTGVTSSEVLLPATLAFTCTVIYQLLDKDQLTDTLGILQEQQYATADIAVVSFDADCYYKGANQAAKQIFPKELSVSERNSVPEKYLADIKQMARNPEKPKIIELDGHYYKCKLNAVYYHEKLRGYNLCIIDITEQKNETKLMAVLKDEADDKTASKSLFLATMSHDLRSPLHAIIGISDIMVAQRDISGNNRSMLLHIKSAGETLLTQVDAILDYSKLEVGKLTLARQGYNLDSIVEELAHISAINLQSKPVQFSICVKDMHPRQFMGDEMRVREIIQNLLANATKYTQEGSIRCEISCIPSTSTKRAFITCSVTDTGAGMNEKQLAQIFEEYVSYSSGRMEHGSGLGLCIVKQLSELMGGTVTATSDGTTGSTVTASFYQEYAGEESCEPFELDRETLLRQTTAYNRSVKPAFTYPKAKVLLAEDMRINQEIFRELVVPWKFEVAFASTGREAVEMAQKENYQMIFLDQMMPEMMGDDAAVKIREFSDAPLVMMTANVSDEMRHTYRKQGFVDFIPKPIEISSLQRTIELHMPKEYRNDPSFAEARGTFADERSREMANKRTLETFIREVEPLAEKLPAYLEKNMQLFRIKVHGIKGVSHGIGKVTLGEWAEIMEMAAKTNNLKFIREHIEDFCEKIRETLKEAREELKAMPAIPEEHYDGTVDKKEVFSQLKTGFDNYQLAEIERCIKLLEEAVLTAEELDLLERAKTACEEMDYEEGSALFR